MLQRFVLSLVLACGSFGTADTQAQSARQEFFQLKLTAEFFNYVKNGSYVEVAGTRFVGLAAAFNSRRTCFYGFSRAGLETPGAYQAQTRFMCFNSGQYQLTVKKEYCEQGSAACAIDPGGISVGIGNLKFIEPTGLAEELPLPGPGSMDSSYPPTISFAVYKSLSQ